MDNDEDTVDAEHRARALAKLRVELAKDVARAVQVAKTCGVWELLRLCYLLRLTRVLLILPRTREKLSTAEVMELQLRDEALKYAIGLVAKHGTWADEGRIFTTRGSFNDYDDDRVIALERIARHINAKFETESMLHVARVRVTGERDQDCFFDLEAGLKDPKRSAYLHFGLRVERSTSRGKDRMLSPPELVTRLHNEFVGVEDLFENQFGISLEKFCSGLLEMNAALTNKFNAAEALASREGMGLINPEETRTFIAMSRAIFFTDAELDDAVNSDFASYLRTHPFEAAVASEEELRFHYLTRRPFLMGEGFAVVSPDLFFDSVLDNAHFTLLEGSDSKAAYMDAGASAFIDRIATAAAQHGYSEVTRDVYLKEGKKDIGDIDLVLYNRMTDHTLLIEGKNHALPLQVYFRSEGAIDAHVARNSDWEKKVKRRVAHLRSSTASYKIDSPWEYLVVSLRPEPIAHLTDLLVLSLDEFEQWLVQDPRATSFSEFYEAIYAPSHKMMSLQEMKRLQEEGYSLPQPADGMPS